MMWKVMQMHSSEFWEELNKREDKHEIIQKYKLIDNGDFTDSYFKKEDIDLANTAWSGLSYEI